MHPRRTVLTGLAALPFSPAAARAGPQPPASPRYYEYQLLTLTGPPAPAFVDNVRTRFRPALAAKGDQLVGLFTPQLGWASNEAAILIRRAAPLPELQGPGDLPLESGLVRGGRQDLLTPTARPVPGAPAPKPGGIYVHRWFEVRDAAIAEFVDLSVQGWRDFETRFEASIFGLFTARKSGSDGTDGVTRMLLLTRYASHAVWEASRDPTTDAMAAFRRRQQLTRSSKAASSLLADTG